MEKLIINTCLIRQANCTVALVAALFRTRLNKKIYLAKNKALKSGDTVPIKIGANKDDFAYKISVEEILNTYQVITGKSRQSFFDALKILRDNEILGCKKSKSFEGKQKGDFAVFSYYHFGNNEAAFGFEQKDMPRLHIIQTDERELGYIMGNKISGEPALTITEALAYLTVKTAYSTYGQELTDPGVGLNPKIGNTFGVGIQQEMKLLKKLASAGLISIEDAKNTRVFIEDSIYWPVCRYQTLEELLIKSGDIKTNVVYEEDELPF